MKYLKIISFLIFCLSCTYPFGQDVGNSVLKQQVQKISFTEETPLYIVNRKEVDEKKIKILKPSDIEHIEVQRPPISTALHGKKALNTVQS